MELDIKEPNVIVKLKSTITERENLLEKSSIIFEWAEGRISKLEVKAAREKQFLT